MHPKLHEMSYSTLNCIKCLPKKILSGATPALCSMTGGASIVYSVSNALCETRNQHNVAGDYNMCNFRTWTVVLWPAYSVHPSYWQQSPYTLQKLPKFTTPYAVALKFQLPTVHASRCCCLTYSVTRASTTSHAD